MVTKCLEMDTGGEEQQRARAVGEFMAEQLPPLASSC